MNRPITVLTITAAFALVACSGSDAAPGSTLEPPSPPPTETTPDTAAPTTDAAPATAAASTTTSTTTTIAPTTTIDPVEELRGVIEQRRLDLEAAFDASQADPSNPDLRDVYRSFYTPEAFVDREQFLDSMVEEGSTLRQNDEMPSSITFPGKFEIVDDTIVIIRVCRVDTAILRIAPTETAPEVIIDDTFIATLADSRFELLNGEWVLAGGDRISDTPGVDECAPAPQS